MLPISSVGAPALGLGGAAIGLIARRLAAAAVENFGAADQDARIDAEGVADKAEHDQGADAKPAAADRKTESASPAAAAAAVATVIDVVAATEIIVTHGAFPSFHVHFNLPQQVCDSRYRGNAKFSFR